MTKHTKSTHKGNRAPCPSCGGRLRRVGCRKSGAELYCRKCSTHGLKKDYIKSKVFGK